MIKYFIVLAIIFSPSLYAEITTSEQDNVKTKSLSSLQWQDIDGVTHHLKETNGKARLLHFWAAWCTPCRVELPEMIKWKEKNSDILIIPLSLDQRIAQAQYFITKNELNMPALLMDKETDSTLSIPVLPYTILIAADGSYIDQYYGMAPWLNDEFTQLLRKKFNLNKNNVAAIADRR